MFIDISGINPRRQGLAEDYVLDFGRYHIPGDTDVSCDWLDCSITHYYYYVQLRAPGDMRQEIWARTSQFVSCVVNRAGLALVVSTIATGGTSVPVFVAAFAVASNECGDVVLADMARAYVSIWRDT